MQEEKMMEVLMDLSNRFSVLQKDVEYLREKMDSGDRAAERNADTIRREVQGRLDLLKKENELQSRQIEALDARVKEIETKEARRVLSRWEQIKDKVFLAVIIVIGYAILAVLNLRLPAGMK